jgi:hypothetical protein
MLRLLRFLITGSWHAHKWAVLAEGSITKTTNPDEPVIGHWYHLRCETCGEVKVRNLR